MQIIETTTGRVITGLVVEDLPAAIGRALQNLPALLDVVVTPEAASSDAKSGLAWVPDLQALGAWDEAEERWRKTQGASA